MIAPLTAELGNAEERKPEPKAVALALINLSPKPRALPEIDEIRRRLPERPRPKLAATMRQHGAVLDFLHDGLDITAGPRTDMAGAYIG